jgi:hypothetical protein
MTSYWQHTGTLDLGSGRHAIKRNKNFSNVSLLAPSPPPTAWVNSIFEEDWEITYIVALRSLNFFKPNKLLKDLFIRTT